MIAALVAAPAVLAAEVSTSGLPQWATILISVVVSAGGAGTILQLALIRQNKKSLTAGTDKIKMEAADILSATAVELLAPLRDELARTNARVAELDAQVINLKSTLNQERITSEVRIAQLEADIAARDRTLQVKDAEIIELRAHIKGSTGWPS